MKIIKINDEYDKCHQDLQGIYQCLKQSNLLEFFISVTPVAKARPRVTRYNVYSTPKTKSYENFLSMRAKEIMINKNIIECPIKIFIGIYLTPPASWSKRKKEKAYLEEILPSCKPDIDNYEKAILDAFNNIIYKDDSLIVSKISWKKYHIKSGVYIKIIKEE